MAFFCLILLVVQLLATVQGKRQHVQRQYYAAVNASSIVAINSRTISMSTTSGPATNTLKILDGASRTLLSDSETDSPTVITIHSTQTVVETVRPIASHTASSDDLDDTTTTIHSTRTVYHLVTEAPTLTGKCKGSTINAPNANILWWQDAIQTYAYVTGGCSRYYVGTGTDAREEFSLQETTLPDYYPGPTLGAAATAVVNVTNTAKTSSQTYAVIQTTSGASVSNLTKYDRNYVYTPFNPSTADITKAFTATVPGKGAGKPYTVSFPEANFAFYNIEIAVASSASNGSCHYSTITTSLPTPYIAAVDGVNASTYWSGKISGVQDVLPTAIAEVFQSQLGLTDLVPGTYQGLPTVLVAVYSIRTATCVSPVFALSSADSIADPQTSAGKSVIPAVSAIIQAAPQNPLPAATSGVIQLSPVSSRAFAAVPPRASSEAAGLPNLQASQTLPAVSQSGNFPSPNPLPPPSPLSSVQSPESHSPADQPVPQTPSPVDQPSPGNRAPTNQPPINPVSDGSNGGLGGIIISMLQPGLPVATPVAIDGVSPTPQQNGVTTLGRQPAPTNVLQTIVSGLTVGVNSQSAIVVDSQTINPGAAPVTIGGNAVSVAQAGTAVAIGNSIVNIPNLPSTTVSFPLITIGGQAVTANSQSVFIIDSQTLSPGGAPITINGQVVSVGPGLNAFVVGSSTVSLVPPAAPTPTPAVITFAGTTLTANSESAFVISGQTLLPGGSALTLGPTVLSLAPAATALVIDASTIPLLGPARPPPVLTLLGGSVITANSASAFIIGSQTILFGSPAVTISDTAYSLAPGATEIVIGSSTVLLSQPTPGPKIGMPILTVGTSVLTENSASAFVIDGKTVAPGGSAITISGTVYSLQPGASRIVVAGSTIQLSKPTDSTRTGNNNITVFTGGTVSVIGRLGLVPPICISMISVMILVMV